MTTADSENVIIFGHYEKVKVQTEYQLPVNTRVLHIVLSLSKYNDPCQSHFTWFIIHIGLEIK